MRCLYAAIQCDSLTNFSLKIGLERDILFWRVLLLKVDCDALQSDTYCWQCGSICSARLAAKLASDLLRDSGTMADFPHPCLVHKASVQHSAMF